MVISRDTLAQVRRIQVRTKRMVTDVLAGGYLSVFRGSGIEFDEVREFAEGDDLRAVDWNVTARTGRPHVKKYMEERELTVLLLLDVSASTEFGTTGPGGGVRTVRQVAAEFCGCIALAAARNNDKAGMIAFGDRIERFVPARKGRSHVLRLIREALVPEGGGRGTDLSAALDFAARVQRRRAVVFLIGDFLDPPAPWQRSLRRLARKHDVIVVRVLDPAVADPPRAGLVHLRDLEGGDAGWVDLSHRKLRRAFAERWQRREAELAELLRRARVDRLDLSTHDSIADAILRFFRMRERRGMRE